MLQQQISTIISQRRTVWAPSTNPHPLNVVLQQGSVGSRILLAKLGDWGCLRANSALMFHLQRAEAEVTPQWKVLC